MIKEIRTLLLAGASLGVAQASIGSTIMINTTVDLSTANFFNNPANPIGVSETHPLPESVLVSVGDTVDMTVNFAIGQILNIRSGGGNQFLSGWLIQDFNLSIPGTSNFTITNASLTFLDLNGSTVRTLAKPSESNGNAQLGPLFQGAYIPFNETLSFSSYRTIFTVTALQGIQYYAGPYVQFADLNGGLVTLTTAVPEPSNAALLLLGVAALLLLPRREA
jgi:MYXO-CTERM domain-containing protein